MELVLYPQKVGAESVSYGGIRIASLRCDAGYSALFVGPERICNPHI